MTVKMSDDNRCPPHGRLVATVLVATVLSRVSVAAVMSNVLRLLDLAINIAIILLSPRILVDSLNPDIFSCRSFEAYVDRFSSR